MGTTGPGGGRRRGFLHQRPGGHSNHRRSQERVVVDEGGGLAADTRLLLPRPSPARSGRLQGRRQLVSRTGKLRPSFNKVNHYVFYYRVRQRRLARSSSDRDVNSFRVFQFFFFFFFPKPQSLAARLSCPVVNWHIRFPEHEQHLCVCVSGFRRYSCSLERFHTER